MNFRIEMICVSDDGTEQHCEAMAVTKEHLAMETLGLTLIKGRARVPYREKYCGLPAQRSTGDSFGETLWLRPNLRYQTTAETVGADEIAGYAGEPVSLVPVRWVRDGAEVAYLYPSSAHFIDCFHISIRLTVLQQQNKAFLEEHPEGGKQVAKSLEGVKHYLWHGNVD